MMLRDIGKGTPMTQEEKINQLREQLADYLEERESGYLMMTEEATEKVIKSLEGLIEQVESEYIPERDYRLSVIRTGEIVGR